MLKAIPYKNIISGKNIHYIATGFLLILLLAAYFIFSAPTPLQMNVENQNGVEHPELLVDEQKNYDGDLWDSKGSSKFFGNDSYIRFNLGEVKTIRAISIQADNNDKYVVSTSLDGVLYKPLWYVPEAISQGLRSRSFVPAATDAKYIEVKPMVGDGNYSITEISVFDSVPGGFSFSNSSPSLRFQSVIVLFCFAVGLSLFILKEGAGIKHWIIVAVIFLPALSSLISSYNNMGIPSSSDAAMTRAAAATIALLAVIRLYSFRKLWKANAKVVTASLSLAAFLGVSAFFNLWNAQFWNVKESRPAFMHAYDMFQYFPVVKYFDELRYYDSYNAALAAIRENNPSAMSRLLPSTQVRNLETHKHAPLIEMEERISRVKASFTGDRWKEFKDDMRFFEGILGSKAYLSIISNDFGSNASPAWISLTYPLFGYARASEDFFVKTALLDPIFLLIGFVMIGWAFGINPMLAAIVVFGANDYYMYGSDWVGSTLRHDWLAYILMGVALLRKKFWFEAGFLLGMAVMMRAFPILLLAGVAVPFAWKAYRNWHRLEFRHLKSLILFFWPLPRIALGAICSAVLLFVLSVSLLDFSAWVEWYRKISFFESLVNGNEIGLSSIVAGTTPLMKDILRERIILYYTLVLIGAGLLIYACRNQLPHQAAVLGSLMIPVIFEPSNYYMHYICILPLLADRNNKTFHNMVIWITMFALCFIQYWATQVENHQIRFSISTSYMLVTWCILVATILNRNYVRENIQR